MKILKNRLFIFILGGILFSSIAVFAVTTISADKITYTDKNNVERTVDTVLDDLYSKANGSFSPELLWTNPNPASSFEEQTISLDLSEYKYIILVTKTGAEDENDYKPRESIIIPINTEYPYGVGAYGGTLYRTVKATTTGVEFGNYSQSNRVIPYKIYGLKDSINIDLGITDNSNE